jgi:uncharacterized protein (DUF697 family)
LYVQADVLLKKRGTVMTEEAEVSEDVVENTEVGKLQMSRHDAALQIISKYVGWSAGTGAVPFPIADIVLMTAVQTKMIKELLALYEVPFSEVRVKSALTVLVSSLSPQMLAGIVAGSMVKLVPGFGQILGAVSLPVLSAATSYASGRVILSHLESGGTMEDFDAEGSKSKFRQTFEEGKKKIKAATSRKKSNDSDATATV